MAKQVNPTRMELTRIKKSRTVAVRGHKLLKDKRDEMVRRFITLIRRNKELREEVEEELTRALKNFVLARAVMSEQVVAQAVQYPAREVELETGKRNIMSVDVPVIRIKEEAEASAMSLYPYSFATTSGELDEAIATLVRLLHRLIELAEIEKTCNMLADEIEKTRRRVNALEYVMIPQFEETIRVITMKLEENERGSLTRLMKMKDILASREA
ncbi:MAG: V-type ATP synthase subunit D [Bacillota bacterium]